ncbi:hypothetical protein MSPP1_001542 [Malassezia sp. CBS 17886]|nr:hypothetical protein MSPP1_001542 [Malassezia sp. CBS 17886]
MEEAASAYLSGACAEVPPSVLDDLSIGRETLLGLVKRLGAQLTSEDELLRSRAVSLLSAAVVHLAGDSAAHAQLTRTAIRTLTVFFSDKLADASALADANARRGNAGPLVPASAPRAVTDEAEKRALAESQMLVDALTALLALSAVGFTGDERVSRDHFAGEDARTVAAALFASVDLRAHPQSLRHLVCRLLDSLVARNRAGLRMIRGGVGTGAPGGALGQASEETPERSVDDAPGDVPSEAPSTALSPAHFSTPPPGAAFVHGYTTLVAGEKDPRNLLILFGIARVLLLEWELDHASTEAFYNILFCYFPITFRPPPDDPYRISPQNLKLALRACLSAIPAFAPLAMPLLLEKLSVSGGGAKLDTLETLSACLPVYGRAAAEANGDALWGYLKLDILQPTDELSADEAQTTLTVLVRILCAEVDPPRGLATTVLRDCLAELQDPGKSLAKTSMKVVQCLIDAAPSTADLAVRRVLELLLARLCGPDHVVDEAPHVLALIAALLDLVLRRDTPATAAVRAFRGELFAALLRGLDSHAETASLHALVVLAQLPDVLTAGEMELATQAIQTVLLAPGVDDALRAQALDGLERILRTHKHAIETVTLPFLLNQLPYELAAGNDAAAEQERIRLALGALTRLGTRPDLFGELVARLFGFLASVCAATPPPAQRARCVGYACALLATVQVCIERKAQQGDTDVPKYAAALPERIVRLLVAPWRGAAPAAAAAVAADMAVVQRAGELLTRLPPQLPAGKQQALVDALRPSLGTPRDDATQIFSPDAPEGVRNLMAAVAAVYIGLQPGVVPPQSSFDAWFEPLLRWLLERPETEPRADALQAQSVSLLLCAIVNKGVDAASFAPGGPAAAVLEQFWSRLGHTVPPARRVQGLEAWVWMARGLLARSSDAGRAMLEQLHTQLFDDAALGAAAARALRLFAQHDGLLTRARGFHVRLLYKQRLLDALLPRLVSDFYAAPPGDAARATCLIAIATLLPALPQTTLQDQVCALLPVLVHTLRVHDACARTSAAQALLTAVCVLPEVAADGEATREAPSDASADGEAPPQAAADPSRPPLLAALQTELAALLDALLDNVRPQAAVVPETRAVVLQVLAVLVPRLPARELWPYRRRVVHALGARGVGIDDPKRAVRARAVDARDIWCRVAEE